MSAFAICPTSLISDRRLTLTDTRTLLGLLSFTQPDRLICWPSRRTLAERIGVSSLARISQTIARLENLGWLAVTRREGSSLYQITPPNLDDPATPRTIPPATPRTIPPEETREFTNNPLTPASGGSEIAVTKTQLPNPTPQLSANVPQEPVTQLPNPTPTVAAAQELVEHLNAVTGSNLPTSPSSAIVRKAKRRLTRFTLEDLKRAITLKGREFRFPTVILRTSILESLISETRAEADRHSAKIAQERALIAALKPPPATEATREVATSALAAMRRMLR